MSSSSSASESDGDGELRSDDQKDESESESGRADPREGVAGKFDVHARELGTGSNPLRRGQAVATGKVNARRNRCAPLA